jgi:type II secretory pathway pseudopilin PulG
VGRVRATLRDEAGYTLIEVLMVCAFLIALFAAFSVLLSSTINSSGEVQTEDVLQTEARSAIDRITQELRSAYTGDGSAAITTMTATQLTFYAPDRGTPFHERQISYKLTSGHLDRAFVASTNDSTGGPPWTWSGGSPTLGAWSKVVTANVLNPTVFTYLDINGNVTATPSAVAQVKMVLTVAPSTARGKQFTYQSSVMIRGS